MRLLCLFGLHHRSGSHAYRNEAGDFVSLCRYCHRPMIKRSNGRWAVADEAALSDSPD